MQECKTTWGLDLARSVTLSPLAARPELNKGVASLFTNSDHNRRGFLGTALTGFVTARVLLATSAHASSADPRLSAGPEAVKQVRAGALNVGYFEAGPSNGTPVMLLHGFPYSVESFDEVTPLLTAQGCRVVVPHLRGHGSTGFLSSAAPRSGQQAAIGMDVIALLDALKLDRAILAGYDWGGRAACVAAALWPERCAGLVSVNGYLIQDISRAGAPISPSIESGLWYQYYFQTERGRAGLEANRREIARTLWIRNSPSWHFDEMTLDRHTSAFDNPDFVDVVIHSYRHRLGLADGFSPYEDVERRLAALPVISVPTITLDGKADGVIPATDGQAQASKISGPRTHRIIDGAGHNLPEEAPRAFADAVLDLLSGKLLFQAIAQRRS